MQCLAMSNVSTFYEKNVAIEKSNPSKPWLTEQWTHAPGTKTCMRRAMASTGDENMYVCGAHRGRKPGLNCRYWTPPACWWEDQVCFCAVLLFLSFGRNFLELLKVRVLDLNLCWPFSDFTYRDGEAFSEWWWGLGAKVKPVLERIDMAMMV